jgi:hypothetical protein
MPRYLIHAWCDRPFIAYLDPVEAETPEEAINRARRQPDKLLDAAEECNSQYPWDEFAAYDERGAELLRVLDGEALARQAAPAVLEALDYLRATLRPRHLDEATDEEVEEALAMADRALAQARTAIALPTNGVSTGKEPL